MYFFISKVRGDTKQKPVEAPSKKDGKSKTSLLKEKCAAGKTFLLNVFKRENSAGFGASAGASSEVIKGAPGTGASIIGHFLGVVLFCFSVMARETL